MLWVLPQLIIIGITVKYMLYLKYTRCSLTAVPQHRGNTIDKANHHPHVHRSLLSPGSLYDMFIREIISNCFTFAAVTHACNVWI